MILNKTVKLKWSGSNIAYYTSKGYKYTKTGDEFEVDISDLSPHSSAKIHTRCDSCGTIKEMKYSNYIRYEEDNIYLCQKCKNEINKTSKQRYKKSFYNWCIENNKDYLNYWDYDKNDISPDQISYGSQRKYYFKCRKNIHESELKQINRITSEDSYACKCIKCSSIAQHGIDIYGDDFIDKYWDNDYDPWEMSYGSRIDIKLKCPYGHPSYITTPQKITSFGIKCPICIKENSSSLQKKVDEYLQECCSGFSLSYENKIPLVPISKNGHLMPYDICINELKLICEVQGVQHYRITNWFDIKAEKNGTTPEQELEYRKEKDEYKKQYALSHGYEYLAIPYWTEKDGSYKQLIDDKIAEINNKLKCKGDENI